MLMWQQIFTRATLASASGRIIKNRVFACHTAKWRASVLCSDGGRVLIFSLPLPGWGAAKSFLGAFMRLILVREPGETSKVGWVHCSRECSGGIRYVRNWRQEGMDAFGWVLLIEKGPLRRGLHFNHSRFQTLQWNRANISRYNISYLLWGQKFVMNCKQYIVQTDHLLKCDALCWNLIKLFALAANITS